MSKPLKEQNIWYFALGGQLFTAINEDFLSTLLDRL
jgi:hypothetical protein